MGNNKPERKRKQRPRNHSRGKSIFRSIIPSTTLPKQSWLTLHARSAALPSPAVPRPAAAVARAAPTKPPHACMSHGDSDPDKILGGRAIRFGGRGDDDVMMCNGRHGDNGQAG